jgi:hypothetical protein
MFKSVFILALVAMAGCASAQITTTEAPPCTSSSDCPSGKKCFEDSAHNSGTAECMTETECDSACAWSFEDCKESNGNYRCSNAIGKTIKNAAALGMGIIIAIIVGILVGIGCCIFCCCYFVCATANRNNNTQG